MKRISHWASLSLFLSTVLASGAGGLAQNADPSAAKSDSKAGVGKSVPQRINEIHISYFWPPRSEPDHELRALIRENQLLVVACPDGCPKLIADFNRAGGLVLLYVSTYKAPVIKEVPDNMNVRVWEGGSPDRTSISANPYWQAVDLTNHPDWMLYAEPNKPRRPFEDPNYMAGWYQTNPSREEYRQAVVKGIEAVAKDPRFDGIMYDNFRDQGRPSAVLKNGRFERIDAETDRTAFRSLARLIRQTGDRASKKHFWIMINGEPSDVAQDIADAIALESFVYSWAWPGSSMDDQQALKRLTSPCTLLSRGGRWVAMAYFGFGTTEIGADGRRIRRITDQAHAIFSDMFTLARPAMVSTFARRNWQKQGGDRAPKALGSEVPGDSAAAREVYGVDPKAATPQTKPEG
jgi:hypothetical protein